MACSIKIDDYRPAPDLVVHRAADILPSLANKDAKVAAAGALIELAKNNLAGHLETQIVQAVDMHRAIEGDFSEAGATEWFTGLDTAISDQLPEFKAELGEDWRQVVYGIRVDQPEMAGAVADAIADRVAKAWHPLPMHRGKFLSAGGIVAEHIKAIGEAVAFDAINDTSASTPQPETPPPPMSGAAAVAAPPPPPLPAGMAPPPPMTGSAMAELGVPGPDELRRAYMAWYHSGAPEVPELAQKLGISQGTFRNWGTGRSTPKCDSGQAATIIADVDARTAELSIARDIFARCL